MRLVVLALAAVAVVVLWRRGRSEARDVVVAWRDGVETVLPDETPERARMLAVAERALA